jgi:hypothetical protein
VGAEAVRNIWGPTLGDFSSLWLASAKQSWQNHCFNNNCNPCPPYSPHQRLMLSICWVLKSTLYITLSGSSTITGSWTPIVPYGTDMETGAQYHRPVGFSPGSLRFQQILSLSLSLSLSRMCIHVCRSLVCYKQSPEIFPTNRSISICCLDKLGKRHLHFGGVKVHPQTYPNNRM